MTLIRTALFIIAGAALLAACSKPAGNTQTASASGAPGATGGPDTTINEADLPHPKAGMWEVTTTVNGHPADVSRNCNKGEPVDLGKDLAKVRQFCAIAFKRTFLGDYVIDSSCNMHGLTGSTHTVVHGDFLGGGYTTDATSQFAMPGHPPLATAVHSVARWVGPC